MANNNEEWRTKLYFDILGPVLDRDDILEIESRYPNPNEEILKQYSDKISDPLILKFYSCFGAWGVKWETRPDFSIRALGIFNFLSIEEVMQDWDNEFGGNSWAPDMKGFRPFDMFYEMEGHVGFFVDRPDKKGLYLSETDGEAQPLHVNFEGYLKLLAMSKGYGWWQNSLIEISTGISKAGVTAFKENMPKIFPEFNWEEFVALYESVRIDK
jgi:hypothetical protein